MREFAQQVVLLDSRNGKFSLNEGTMKERVLRCRLVLVTTRVCTHHSRFVAGEMIDKLTLMYNRKRQAVITTELIEIISGAAALD